MGFGECGPGIPQTAAGSGVFTINLDDAWYMFAMPMDGILRGFNFNVTNGGALTPTSDITPYVVISTAPPGSRTYTFLNESLTNASEPFLNGTLYPVFTKTIPGESVELNIPLAKGTQVAITLGINTGGTAQAPLLICSGGLLIEPA